MVVAQLPEQSIPIPEVRGSIPVIVKFYVELTVVKTEIKKMSL